MKKLLFIILTFCFSSLFSQDYSSHIPENALAVFEINFPKILEAMPLEEFEKSEIGAVFLKNLSKVVEKEDITINDLGFNTNTSHYIFFVQNKNQLDLVFLHPLNQSETLTTMLGNKYEITDTPSDHQYVSIKDGSRFFWNSRLMTFVSPVNIDKSQYSDSFEWTPYLSPVTSSLQKNALYQKNKDPKAASCFWVNDLGNAMVKLSKGMNKLNYGMEYMDQLYDGYKNFSMKLYFKKEQTELVTNLTLDDDLGELFKKISQRKFNKELLNYVDLNNCLAYFSNSIHTGNFLEYYPEVMKKQFAALPETGSAKEEILLGLSAFSTLIDEEAISEIIPGDFLFVLNGIEEKEVEYVTYEYDSNYNMLPITKTKMEKVPEFMLLSSTTESNSLLKSTINYLESKKLLEKKSGYYKIVSYPGISIDLYLMIKNNILFLGSSESQFESIIKGSYVPKVSDEIAKMISGNQTYMYVGLSKFESLFRNSNTEISEKGNRSVELIKKSPDFYFVTGKPKKNISSNKLIITTPQGYKNGLDYLVQLLGELN